MVSETWKPVVGYEGRYMVSDQGRVCSLRYRGHEGQKILKATKNWAGYYVVSLHNWSGKHQYRVHVLVLTAFVGPRPKGMQGCHDKDNKEDNRLVSLRWDTPKGNVADRNTACGERHGRSKLTDAQKLEVIAARASGEALQVIADRYGISDVRVSQICKQGVDWPDPGLPPINLWNLPR